MIIKRRIKKIFSSQYFQVRKKLSNATFNGGALYYAIFVCIILFSLIGLVFLSTKYQRIHVAKVNVKTRLRENIDNAAKYVASGNAFKINKKFNLYNSQFDTVSVGKMRWGGFKVFKVKSYNGKFVASRAFLMGAKPLLTNSYSLFKMGDLSAINMCGVTNLDGGVNVPLSYFKDVRIGNKKNDIQREIKYVESDNYSLKFNIEFVDAIKSICERGEMRTKLLKEFPNSIGNSFLDSTLVIFNKDRIDLRGYHISGNVILISEKKVILTSKTNVENSIIYAPEIIVEDGFEGSCQLYSNQHIKIAKNCTLKYPSICCLLLNDERIEAQIIIQKGAIVQGAILCVDELKNVRKGEGVCIDIKGEVNGLLHSDGNVKFNGTLNGSLVFNNLLHKKNNSLYKNHLIDVSISQKSLNPFYSEPFIYEAHKEMEIIDWLD